MRTSRRSPTRTTLAGLTDTPSTFTWPAPQASDASERVLNMRAAHSHLSMRTSVGSGTAAMIPAARRGREAPWCLCLAARARDIIARMSRARRGWVVGLVLGGCTTGVEPGVGTFGGPSSVATTDATTSAATEAAAETGAGDGSAGTQGAEGTSDGPDACDGMMGTVALGGTCMDPCDCASGRCFAISLGSACSECTSDVQCMAAGEPGTCSADFTLDPPYARCTGGELGVMCQLGSGGCQAGLVCAQVIDTMGLLPDYFCSECATTADCPPAETCVPVVEYGGLAISSGSLQCVAPGSLADGALCPLLPDGSGNGGVCASGRCAVTDVAGLGIVQIGVCSPCAGDEDCPAGTACQGASVDENGTVPAACG